MCHAPHGACELKFDVPNAKTIHEKVTLPTERVS